MQQDAEIAFALAGKPVPDASPDKKAGWQKGKRRKLDGQRTEHISVRVTPEQFAAFKKLGADWLREHLDERASADRAAKAPAGLTKPAEPQPLPLATLTGLWPL